MFVFFFSAINIWSVFWIFIHILWYSHNYHHIEKKNSVYACMRAYQWYFSIVWNTNKFKLKYIKHIIELNAMNYCLGNFIKCVSLVVHRWPSRWISGLNSKSIELEFNYGLTLCQHQIKCFHVLMCVLFVCDDFTYRQFVFCSFLFVLVCWKCSRLEYST